MENKFETEVITRLTKIETKLDDYKDLKEKTDRADNRSIENEKDIKELQEKIKWISRSIIGAIITAVIGVVFIYLKSGLGIS